MSKTCKKCECAEMVSSGARWKCTRCGATQLKEPKRLSKSNESFSESINSNNTKEVIHKTNKPLTLENMLKAFDVDSKVWKPENFKINSWDVTNGQGQTFTNYQTKATLKRDDIQFKEDIAVDVLVEKLKKYKHNIPKTVKKYNVPNEDNMLEINLFDVHIDKLATLDSSGEDYNMEIAKERMIETVMDIVTKANLIGYDTVYLPIGNDFFNADNILNTTTKGTPQDVDNLWTEVFEMAVELLTHVIDYLRNYATNIIIPVVRGNHDSQRCFYLGHVIKAFYHGCDDVEVDARSINTKFYKFGKCLLGYLHGDSGKIDNLPMVMAQLNKEWWAETTFREFHLGHLHSKKNFKYTTTLDDYGVTVRYMRSISGVDEWHYTNGYVGNMKGADGYIWNKNRGVEFVIESKIVV